ncbi:MAG: SRPBCC family protein [Thermomicrobiales bacterium]
MRDHDDASLATIETGYQLRLERIFPQSIETVWSALTDSEERGNWLATGQVELRKGAQFTWTWTNVEHSMQSTVLEVDPPRLLEFYWHQQQSTDSVVRWELAPEGAGTRFTLTHTLPDLREAPDTLSGWHTHVEMLGQFLKNEPSPWNWDRWRELKKHYVETLTSEGYVFPSSGREFDDEGNELTSIDSEPATAR